MNMLTEHEYKTIKDILSEVKTPKEEHHLGRPFLTTYQIAIHLKKSHEGIFNEIKRKCQEKTKNERVGGVEHGDHHSPAQYLGKALSRRVKEQQESGLIEIEGGFFSGQDINSLIFNDEKAQDEKEKKVTASLNSSTTISIFRIAK